MLTVAELRADHFRPLLQQTFTLELAPETRVTLRLVEVAEGRAGGKRTPFSLLFQAPAGTPLQQGIFALSHDTLGRFELFMVPMLASEEGPRLEIGFS
jgi:hypothetical protein